MTTPTTTKPDEGIPEFLKLTDAERAEGRAQAAPAKHAAMTSTPPAKTAGVKANIPETDAPKPNRAARRAAASNKTKDAAAKIAKAHNAKAAKPAKAKAEAADEEEGPTLTRSIVPVRYKAVYAEHEDTCGTSLSLALKHATTGKNEDGRLALLVPELKAIAEQNGVWNAAYNGLNNGQKRMNVYNRLVGLLNKGTDVRIGKKVFRAKDWTPPTKPGFKAKVAKDAKPLAKAA